MGENQIVKWMNCYMASQNKILKINISVIRSPSVGSWWIQILSQKHLDTPSSMILGGVRKPENPEETQMAMERTCTETPPDNDLGSCEVATLPTPVLPKY